MRGSTPEENPDSDNRPTDAYDPRAGKAERLDGPHEVRPASAKAPAPIAAHSASAADGADGEVRPLPMADTSPLAEQAADLAERLAERQADLDRRAEDVAIKEADLEGKLQAARLWFDEQQSALDARVEQREQAGEATGGADVDAAAPNAEALKLAEAEAARQAEREAELDRRQAELYEQIDKLTADRAGFAEREAKLDGRQTALDGRQAEIDRLWQELTEQRSESAAVARENQQQAAELEAARAELAAEQEDIANQQADLAACETQLAGRRAEVEAAIKRFEGLGVTEQRVAELAEQAQQFQARARYLDQAEAMLTDEKQALADDRRRLAAERQQTQEAFVVERRRIEAERSETRTLATQNEKLFAAKEAEIDQRQTALGQLQAELEAGQREVLEMRLATEETWAQLAGALAPATLTRSIAQVRSRLADHYQHTLEEIGARRKELADVTGKLSAEHQRIDEQRARLQQWASRREEDIEQRAARLIARERELDRQQRHYEQLETRWTSERANYRDKITELLAEVRDCPSPAEPATGASDDRRNAA
ncbi:MAG: hypothetical protein AAGB00_02975 [Planctomycetota bacterium]